MNRFISALVAVLLAAAGTAAGGYWNPLGVVPVGDARIPAHVVGWLITIGTGLCGASAGGSVPWKTWLAGLLQDMKIGAGSIVDVAVPGKLDETKRETVPSNELALSIAASVPVEVQHLQGCVYHLRVVLRDDPDAQGLLDQIAVKVGRATAGVKGGAV